MLFITKKIICERIPVAKVVEMIAFMFCTTDRSEMLTPSRMTESIVTKKLRSEVSAKLQASHYSWNGVSFS